MSRSRHRVQRRRRLVEDQDPRVLEQHAGDREALLLAARELVAALADDRVEAVGQLRDPVVDRGRAGRRLELRVGRLGPGEQQVLADRRVEQVRLLGHEPDEPRRATRAGSAGRRCPSIETAPVVDVVQARDEVGRRRLAGARRADERHELAGSRLERDVLEPERRRPAASGSPPRRRRRGRRRARHRARGPVVGDDPVRGRGMLQRVLVDDLLGHVRVVGGRIRGGRAGRRRARAGSGTRRPRTRPRRGRRRARAPSRPARRRSPGRGRGTRRSGRTARASPGSRPGR